MRGEEINKEDFFFFFEQFQILLMDTIVRIIVID